MKSKNNSVRVALVQMTCTKDKSENIKKAVAQIKLAAKKGAQIVGLQELFNTLYFCQTQDTQFFDLAESVPGPTVETLMKTAKETKTVIVAPIFEKQASGIFYNTAAVIDADGKYLGKYRKMHIPDDPGFYEKFYFVPGDLGFKTFKTKYAEIGVLICWDQWFPEAARITALKGAQILFYPTAIGWKPAKPEEAKYYQNAWHTIQASHAVANGVYVASTNRVGKEGDFKFWGGSFVSDPFGKVLTEGDDKETILIQDCDLSLVEQTRREWPFFRDRRIDAYHSITSRVIQ